MPSAILDDAFGRLLCTSIRRRGATPEVRKSDLRRAREMSRTRLAETDEDDAGDP